MVQEGKRIGWQSARASRNPRIEVRATIRPVLSSVASQWRNQCHGKPWFPEYFRNADHDSRTEAELFVTQRAMLGKLCYDDITGRQLLAPG